MRTTCIKFREKYFLRFLIERLLFNVMESILIPYSKVSDDIYWTVFCILTNVLDGLYRTREFRDGTV